MIRVHLFNRAALWLLCAAAGVCLGLGFYTFVYAKGYSYLLNDPRACANCHVMQDPYDSWVKSSHHQAATCNDCHIPHALIPKYWAKSRNGFNHSKAFTLQNFPEPIRITPHNLEALQHNCLDCHSGLLSDIAGHQDVQHQKINCTQCHNSVGHMHL